MHSIYSDCYYIMPCYKSLSFSLTLRWGMQTCPHIHAQFNMYNFMGCISTGTSNQLSLIWKHVHILITSIFISCLISTGTYNQLNLIRKPIHTVIISTSTSWVLLGLVDFFFREHSKNITFVHVCMILFAMRS